MKRMAALVALLALLGTGACTKHKVAMTHDIQPIHITMDINLKIDTDLDKYFGAVDAATETVDADKTNGQEKAQ